MIPKSSGGSHPQDQRPITVLDVAYRVWAKGLTLHWGPTFQREYLGAAAMGFREHSGTIHVSQLLSDVITMQARRRQPLWLVAFDIEKCFPTLPWWALFGVLGEAGVPSRLVSCFRSFYASLHHHFRYGHVDGSSWSMANGLAQGCPASPDLLNFLFEPFHRWAAAQGKGVFVVGQWLASVSFADDVTLLATSLEDAAFLVSAYCEWCHLLEINVHAAKTKVCTSTGAAEVAFQFGLDSVKLQCQPTYHVVGIELGANDRLATVAHLSPRLSKALQTGRRLAALDVPAAVAAQLWRSTVLAQGLYGCELRNITSNDVVPLVAQGKALIVAKTPLQLSHYRASEVITGPPMGSCALRDPRDELLSRRIRWFAALANDPGIVGSVHRALVAPTGPPWVEPTASLASAIAATGWTVYCNMSSIRATAWPLITPEPRYTGQIFFLPQAEPPPQHTVWTDGSIRSSGGAAAVMPSLRQALTCRIPAPQSSTQCELVALSLASRFTVLPELILTDSLCSLQLISSWASRSSAWMSSCPRRARMRASPGGLCPGIPRR